VELLAAQASKGPPRFSTLAYGGGAMRIGGYDAPMAIDLAGLTSRNDVQANLDHDTTRRVGQVDGIHNDGKQLILAGVVSAASTSAAEFLDSAAKGYRWQASVEVTPDKIEEVPRGNSVQVNGRQLVGPLYVTRAGVLHGVAFVAAGADDQTHVSIAAKRKAMNTEAGFKDWVSQMMNDDIGDMTGAQLSRLHANYCGRTNANAEDLAAVSPMIKASADPVVEENRRLRQINAAVRGLENVDRAVQLKAQAVRGELDVDELLAELRPIRSDIEDAKIPMAHAVHSSRRGSVDGSVIEAALLTSLGCANVEKHFDEWILQAAHTEFRGRASLGQVLLASAAANGMSVRPGDRINAGNLGEVLHHCFAPIHASGGFSTNSIATTLSNVAGKMALQGWQEGDISWREVAQIKSVSDFKEHTSFRLLDDLEYEEIGPGSELKHGTLSDENFTRQAKTYGRMIAITRTDLINDDQSALADTPLRIGRGGLSKFNKVFWAKFINNSAFFHTDHGNVSTGSPGSVLGTDGVGLQAAVLKFRKLISPDGKSVDGEPTILLIPPEVEFNGRRLYQSTNFSATGDTDTVVASANPFAGLFRPVVQRRLSDSAFTGYSTTAWYLLRNPSIAAVVVASFLNGQQNPTVETAQANFNTLGIEMRGYHDWGCDQSVDYLAGVRSAGA
jgi:hypothetical protein